MLNRNDWIGVTVMCLVDRQRKLHYFETMLTEPIINEIMPTKRFKLMWKKSEKIQKELNFLLDMEFNLIVECCVHRNHRTCV